MKSAPGSNLLLPLVAACVLGAGSLAAAAEAPDANERLAFFEAKIRPVLVAHCYECHSADAAQNKKLKGGLRLDSREATLRGGESGAVVVAGKPDASLLISALKHEDLKMPPKGRLPAVVIADFVKWIELGAPDPRDGPSAPPAAVDIDQGRRFWAFVPPQAHPRPTVRDAAWPRRELDWFIRAAQEEHGLTRVRTATKEEWLRRATFDLVGLPPTPEELDAFVRDESPEAFGRVVDRLLASPHYGERWGRHWLDVARYADDLGGTVSPKIAPNAYRYRDWVIRALNADLPYDQFVRLQLAGDLIAAPANDYVERLGGLGFQGLGQRFSGNAVGMVKKKAADELDDRVDTVTRSLLALTVSCARCHDHKFDPIPTQDYYSLAAAYNGADWVNEVSLASPAVRAGRVQWEKSTAEHRDRKSRMLQAEGDRVGREQLPRIGDYLLAAWQLHALAERKINVDVAEAAARRNLDRFFLARWQRLLASKKPLPLLERWQKVADAATNAATVKEGVATEDAVEPPPELVEQTTRLAEDVRSALAELQRLERETHEKKDKPAPLSQPHQTILKVFLQNDGAFFKIVGDEIVPYIGAELRQQYDALQAELDRLATATPPEILKAPGVTRGGQALRINVRGDAENLGDEVPPGFLQVLSPPRSGDTSASPTPFTRLDLADAIASRDNPLTARVYVNRVWHHHFGRGMVGTLSNFGQIGDRPTHPELLDTLAVRFMEADWSTKWLHREIMLSATYRLSSQPDAANQERDADHAYLWRMPPRRLDFEVWRDAMLAVADRLDRRLGGPPLVAPGGEQLHPEDPAHSRRTIYCFISRFKPNPTLTLFDFPEPNVTSERRNVTTIPQQQLFALNSRFTVAMGKAFAARLQREASSDEERVRLAWRLAFARQPVGTEIDASLEYLRATSGNWNLFCHGLLMSNEFAFVP